VGKFTSLHSALNEVASSWRAHLFRTKNMHLILMCI